MSIKKKLLLPLFSKVVYNCFQHCLYCVTHAALPGGLGRWAIYRDLRRMVIHAQLAGEHANSFGVLGSRKQGSKINILGS